jgi:ribosomal 50S subunit-recycling heat shock protein
MSGRWSSIGSQPCDDAAVEVTRIDRWLWAVRLYKTRSNATDACRGGHVRVNGTPAKAAASVRVGDRVTARVNGDDRILEVVRLIDKRVSATVAAECLVDHSPPPAPREFVAPAFVRDPAAGRPTKKERRQLDRFREH